MTTVSLIAAMDRNRVIGMNNKMPWHLPADLKHFKRVTVGKPIVMGRNTYDSLGRPLPGRLNIVLSRQADLRIEGCEVVSSVEDALKLAGDVDEVMIIGGANLYRQTIDLADKLYLTYIDEKFEGDTFFPEVNPAMWQIDSEEKHYADEKNRYDYRFVNYSRLR